MTDEEKELKSARIILKDAAAKRARLEWRTKLADPSALTTRQMTQEIINQGDMKSLEVLAKYFGVSLKETKVSNKNTDGMYTAVIGNGYTVAFMIKKV